MSAQNKAKQIDKNLPNKLTVLRIILVPVFILLLWLPAMTGGAVSDFTARCLAAIVFAVSAATDFVDGKLARKYELVSNFGKFMDEAFEWALVVCLLIIIFRELAVSSMRLIAKNAEGLVIAAALPGKIKTFSQCIFVLLLLLEEYIFAFSDFFVTYRPLTWTCMAVMVFFTIYSGIQYFHVYKRFIFDA